MSGNEFDALLANTSWRRDRTAMVGALEAAGPDEQTVADLGADDGATIVVADGPEPFAIRGDRAAATAPMGQQANAARARGRKRKGDVKLPPPGTQIDQYELIRELGRGGMGAVYLARDTKLARRVAIKFLLTGKEDVTQRFFQEAQATAQFNHENIVIIHDYGEYQQNPYMVLEYLQGVPLSKMLTKGQSLPPSRAVEIMIPVVKALVAAHEHNIVHRDLKPDNIYITDVGTIKVLDFGIAKILQSGDGEHPIAPLLDQPLAPLPESLADESTGITGYTGVTGPSTGSSSELTRRGAIMGTVPYMSPEQWGIDSVDHRTDIWAVGILLFRMIAGRHPLHPLRGQQLVITAMLEQPMPSVRAAVPNLDSGLADVIDRCLIKHKAQRLGSARELLRALEPFRPGRFAATWDADQSPYAGLSAFQEADASRFFGRSREIASAATRLRDQPLIGVVGPSGVGKSSFVRAGVVPALKQSGEAWETLVVRPGRQPMLALANSLASLLASDTLASTTSVSDETSYGALARDLSEQQAVLQRLYVEPGFLGTVLRSRARSQNRHIMLFVDQFEELYTLVPDYNTRLAFTSCLTGVADDATAPLRVVISLRSDFLDRVAESPLFMQDLTQGLYFLSQPNRAGLREALTMPAEMAGFHFESPAMIDDMLDHLADTPGALPLLQFAATKLWDARDTERKLLTEHSYRDMGGIAGALASHADSVITELPPTVRRLVRSLFLRLVTPERTRAIVSVGELYELSPDPNEIQRLLEHLVQARLLVVQTGDLGSNAAGAQVEIVHESLIHSWPTLRRWLDENQDDAAFLEQLRNAARQWDAKGRPQGLLWRGEAMEEASRWHKRYRGDLPRLQAVYLRAVFALARRAVRGKRLILGTVIATLTLAATAAVIGLVLIRDAERQATAEAARAVAAEQVSRQESERARKSETEAKQALSDLQAEMLARQQAERERAQAETDLEAAYRRLQDANKGLEVALRRAKRARRRAGKEKARAEENASAATLAQRQAEQAQAEAERLYQKERERYERALKRTGGSKRMDVLK